MKNLCDNYEEISILAALSTDEIPFDVEQGSILILIDTAKRYMFDGIAWVNMSDPSDVVDSAQGFSMEEETPTEDEPEPTDEEE